MKIKKEECMTIKQFRKLLSLYDQDLPVIIQRWVDRHPFDGEGTDMSGNEPVIFNENMLEVRRLNSGMDNQIDFQHLCITSDRY